MRVFVTCLLILATVFVGQILRLQAGESLHEGMHMEMAQDCHGEPCVPESSADACAVHCFAAAMNEMFVPATLWSLVVIAVAVAGMLLLVPSAQPFKPVRIYPESRSRRLLTIMKRE